MRLLRVEGNVLHPPASSRLRQSIIFLSLSFVVLLGSLVFDFAGWSRELVYGLAVCALILVALGGGGVVVGLRGSGRSMDNFLAVSPNPMQLADASGVIRYVNPAFERWTGETRATAVGTNIAERVQSTTASDQMPRLGGMIFEALGAGRVWSGMVRLSLPGNKPLVAHLIVVPLSRGRKQGVESLWMYNDLTGQERLVTELSQSQEQYRQLVENSLEGIVIVQDGSVGFANCAAAAILNFASPEELQGRTFEEMIAPPSRPFGFGSLEGRKPGEQVLRNLELKGMTRTGEIIDLEMNARITRWGDHEAVQTSFRDITERKQLEREQAQWFWEQEVLGAIDRHLSSFIDLSTVFEMISHHARSLTRADWAGVLVFRTVGGEADWVAIRGNVSVGTDVRVKLGDVWSDLPSKQDAALLTDARTELGEHLDELFPFDAERVASMARLPLRRGNVIRGQLVLVFHQRHEFTDREERLLVSLAEKSSLALANAEMYESLRRHEEELRLLTLSRVNAQEDERRRLAREIHDGLGQILTATKFTIEVLEDAKNLTDDDRKKLAEVRALLDGAMKEAREISHNLMPSVLEDFGLDPALQVLCEQASNASKLAVRYQSHGNVQRLGDSIETGLYRIAQEALNNIIKHAAASKVDVDLAEHDDVIRLTITDDGMGFDVGEVERRSHPNVGIGLVSMRERALSLGGTFHLDARPDSGTKILVELPVPRS